MTAMTVGSFQMFGEQMFFIRFYRSSLGFRDTPHFHACSTVGGVKSGNPGLSQGSSSLSACASQILSACSVFRSFETCKFC